MADQPLLTLNPAPNSVPTSTPFSSGTSSLDELLQKIKSDTDVVIAQSPAAPAARPGQATSLAPSSGSLSDTGELSSVVTLRAASEPSVSATGEDRIASEIWETNLSPRQQTLPKISANMLGGIVAIFVMMVGVGAATTLSQRSQDIRQQASEGSVTVEGPAATMTVGMSADGTELDNPLSLRGWMNPSTWTLAQITILVTGGVVVVSLIGALMWVLKEA